MSDAPSNNGSQEDGEGRDNGETNKSAPVAASATQAAPKTPKPALFDLLRHNPSAFHGTCPHCPGLQFGKEELHRKHVTQKCPVVKLRAKSGQKLADASADGQSALVAATGSAAALPFNPPALAQSLVTSVAVPPFQAHQTVYGQSQQHAQLLSLAPSHPQIAIPTAIPQAAAFALGSAPSAALDPRQLQAQPRRSVAQQQVVPHVTAPPPRMPSQAPPMMFGHAWPAAMVPAQHTMAPHPLREAAHGPVAGKQSLDPMVQAFMDCLPQRAPRAIGQSLGHQMASLGPQAWMDQVQQAQMAPRGQLHANAAAIGFGGQSMHGYPYAMHAPPLAPPAVVPFTRLQEGVVRMSDGRIAITREAAIREGYLDEDGKFSFPDDIGYLVDRDPMDVQRAASPPAPPAHMHRAHPYYPQQPGAYRPMGAVAHRDARPKKTPEEKKARDDRIAQLREEVKKPVAPRKRECCICNTIPHHRSVIKNCGHHTCTACAIQMQAEIEEGNMQNCPKCRKQVEGFIELQEQEGEDEN